MVPDRLFVDDSDREIYEKCEREGIFVKGLNNKDKFIFALSIGFKNDYKRTVKMKFGFFHVRDLRPEDEALIYSIAILKNKIDIMSDKKNVYNLVEEYARGGIKILSDQIESGAYGSYWKHYEQEISDLLNNIPPE